MLSYHSKLKKGKNLDFIKDEFDDKDDPKMSVTYSDYPKYKDRHLAGFDVISTFGAFYFFVPYMVSYIIIVISLCNYDE